MRKKAPQKGNVIASPSKTKGHSGHPSAMKSRGVTQEWLDERRAESVAHFKDHAPGVPVPESKPRKPRGKKKPARKSPRTAEEWAREWNKAVRASKNYLISSQSGAARRTPKPTGARSNSIAHQNFPKKNRSVQPFSDEEIIALKDYLAGDTDKGEVKAAAYYEYAREEARKNKRMKAVVEQLRAMPKKRKGSLADLLGSLVDSQADWFLEMDKGADSRKWSSFEKGWAPDWIERDPWPAILACESFPAKPWTALNQDEKRPIIRAAKYPSVLPELRQRTALRMIADHKPREDDPIRYVTFGIDFSADAEGLRDSFARWLALKKNQALLKRFKPKGSDREGKRFKVALRDLAAVRILLECKGGFDEAVAMTQRMHKIKADGEQKKFYGVGSSYTNAPLYDNDPQMSEAKDRVEAFARELFPGW